MFIKLNNENIIINTVKDGDKLSITLYNIDDLSAVFQAFQPGSMPEITIYDDDHSGKTMEIYANHKVIGLYMNPDSSVQVDLQVDPLEISKAVELTEELEVQKENASMNESVIDEILALLASHEERLSALEPVDEIVDEGGAVE